MRKNKKIIVGLLLLSFMARSVFAVETSIWNQNSADHFRAGIAEEIAITNEGDVMLSRKLTEFFDGSQQLYVWSIAEDSNGNIYAGTGDGGKIYKITPGGEYSLFYDSPEISIISLAVDRNDNLYAGTAPSGLIYKINAGENTPTTLLSSEENYIWSLNFDREENLYATTGPNGKVFKVDSSGNAQLLFDSNESNLICGLSRDDGLYVGSDGKGTVYRIDPDGNAETIYQTGQKEVRALAEDRHGNLYAGTLTVRRRQKPPSKAIKVKREQRNSYIYRITPERIATKIWAAPDPMILSMVVAEDGEQLFVGTGDRGNFYLVNPSDGTSINLGKAIASQILAIHRSENSGKVFMATGNPGRILFLPSEYVDEGTLTSKVHDTKSISRWGKISWHQAGTGITFATRSGNTDEPDDTWSTWSEELSLAEGSQIKSPWGRFIQWRATFGTSQRTTTPILKKVELASVQLNIAPRFDSIEVVAYDGTIRRSRDGIHNRRGLSEVKGESGKNGSNEASSQSLSWQVYDANGDELQYAIYYKRVGDAKWKSIKKKLRKNSYPWDSTSLPDGDYQLKVEANDSPSNPLDRVKSAEKISGIFRIDNSQPDIDSIEILKGDDGKYQLRATLSDASSRIKSTFYKIDGEENWKRVFPADEVFDAKTERIILYLDPLPAGEHTVTLKVTDVAGNSTVAIDNF